MTDTKQFINQNKKPFITYRTHKEVFLEELSRSEEDRRIYLEVAIEEYEKDRFLPGLLLALRNIATASGGMQKLAEKTSLSRQTLYKALSPKGNPSFVLIDTIINSFGLQFTLKSR